LIPRAMALGRAGGGHCANRVGSLSTVLEVIALRT
jgi:hypothetical protein